MCTHLEETDGVGLLTEALTAEVKAVLADETSLVRAETAVPIQPSASRSPPSQQSITIIQALHHSSRIAGLEEGKRNSPLTAALAVLAGAREPNGVVGHFV
ncbi:hypothetical protein NUW54_g13110 [Trametes sanguinea]|uniref:Uncharacterized protein n=1 Tax=Trametes sanguinea TaxID=158606 RepID=A0ACC1MR39_9APHY|nr:hypothetical protein NUW54_g13110 [Trametes sanguinea]